MKGIFMRNRYPNRQRAAAFAGILAVALAMAFGAGSAFAEDDDDVPLDTKVFRRVMKELGFRNGDEGIEYRERAPLVVPPSRNLPPPQSEGPSARNPAWPKDPDVARRREATAAEKAKLRRSSDNVIDDARPLRPDELKGQPGAPATASTEPARPSAEEAARPLNPSQLRGDKNWFDSFVSAVGPQRPETAPFTGEPPRTSMTAPPPGYQTPSPNQPYGVGVEQTKAKAQTLESRMEPAR
jgi:hypothetical protein